MSVSVCQGRVWQDDFDSARTAVKKSNNLLLIGFFTPGNQRSEQLRHALLQVLAIPYMNEHCDLVISDFQSNIEIAKSMEVFRVGTLLAFLPNGKQLARLNGPLQTDQLKAFIDCLLPALNKMVDSGALTTVPLMLRDGYFHDELVYGPVSVSATTNAPLEIGTLEKDQSYLIVVSGQYSVWPDALKRGVDAAFYRHPKYGGTEKPFTRTKTLKLPSLKLNFSDLWKAQSDGKAMLQPEHVYEVLVQGTGEALTVAIADESPQDNSGELYVTVYQTK